jgi:uncharacterized protein (TIGR00251 family)
VIRFDPVEDGVEFDLKVVPGSSRERIAGEYDGRLKVAVTLPAEGGKANRAVVRLLAERLGRARREVEIVSGHGSPFKRVRVTGTTIERLRASLAAAEGADR